MARRDKRIGLRFRSAYADSNPMWEVILQKGRRGVYVCEIVNEPIAVGDNVYESDGVGERRLFTREEIDASVAYQAEVAARYAIYDAFYESLPLGAVVHYENGGGQWIRCEVVIATGLREDLDHYCLEEGEKALKQIAFVGRWEPYALHVNAHTARWLRAGYRFHPNPTCIYEFSGATSLHRGEDPATLPVVMSGSEPGT